MKVSFLTQGMMRPTDLEMTATVCYFQFPGGRTHMVPTGKYQGGSGCRGSGISAIPINQKNHKTTVCI